ncbi:putative pentatricopeptide repeat-containing protein At1g16830 isoform X2 [Coffea eugenioides]|uniref:putative pentatricopeptide repeat-containing protein At1g16830 isoform X2 n=1 Tax=Coffea eugenioides TaxID=49369 RepID=UPI000F60E650|nr:putative pentatricopeptide repeat-containing protein At1g16830 isoform X2 [Coffea eugenioides]
MIWRLRYKFWKALELKPTSYFLVKSQPLVAIHYLASPLQSPTTEKHKKFETFLTREEFYSKSSGNIVLNPHIVQKTLIDCRSDVVALSFFLWCARQPDYFHDRAAFSHMVNVVSRLIQRFSTLGGILEELAHVGCATKPQTLLLLLRIFWYGKMYELVFEAFEEMLRHGYTPNTFARNIVVDVLFKIGKVGAALKVLEETEEFLLLPLLISGLVIEPDLVMCNSLLNYFCKAGHPTGAIEFYNDMIHRGFKPDKYSYAGLLSGLCRSGRIHEAVNVYNGIVQEHLGLDAHLHTIIIDGLIKTGNFHSAIKFFRKAGLENFPLDVVSYTVAINGLLKGGRAGEAYNLFFQMKDLGITPNIYTYNLVLSGFCKDRDVKMIKGILQEMSDVGVEIDNGTLNLMKSFLYKWHCYRPVFELFVELWDSGLLPKKMYALLTDELGRGLLADDAPKKFQKLAL